MHYVQWFNKENTNVSQSDRRCWYQCHAFPLVPVYMMPTGHAVIGGLLARDQTTLYIWQGGVGGFCGDQKNDSAIKISIVALHKLMTMSSYLINSNYIEPSFPPCDEYQQSGYIPSHGDYYERPKDTGFPHHDEQSYPRSSYTETGYDYGNISSAANATGLDDFSDGHHTQPSSVTQSHGARLSVVPDGGAGANGSKDCTLAGEVYPGVVKGKEPVVYPWMKKVHISSGKFSFTGSACMSPLRQH